jgi:hypothetical protein
MTSRTREGLARPLAEPPSAMRAPPVRGGGFGGRGGGGRDGGRGGGRSFGRGPPSGGRFGGGGGRFGGGGYNDGPPDTVVGARFVRARAAAQQRLPPPAAAPAGETCRVCMAVADSGARAQSPASLCTPARARRCASWPTRRRAWRRTALPARSAAPHAAPAAARCTRPATSPAPLATPAPGGTTPRHCLARRCTAVAACRTTANAAAERAALTLSCRIAPSDAPFLSI